MTERELQRLTEELSLRYFKKSFKHRAYFNSRLKTTGGRYLMTTHHIELNKRSFEKHGINELIGIIKHELCHYHLHLEGKGYRHRDLDFKLLLKKVGAPRYCKSVKEKEQKKSQVNYMYKCSGCNVVYHRKRKMDTNRYVCGECKSKIFLV